ncbi:hypothetical protein SAMN05661096_01040 [Marivirga sericea]|uniref:Uncharacterized protein n=1 Tax=Marivirga sericea TaxID=1028 RepID=A0A1X7ISQ6_9BACT|nr:hypothetical protein SAMN05661096_01040 [Marivirga sericea]
MFGFHFFASVPVARLKMSPIAITCVSGDVLSLVVVVMICYHLKSDGKPTAKLP